ncbi:MAG: hypothetical protein K940chlam3_00460 [Chlamydiae bacterium]|nr:hypothetical protein [Chlamydiota bacterium]
MDFTREPVIETVITPREGCKLVVRSSKGASQEEYFVDAVEVVSFGSAFFYRSLEKPKCFLLPVVDYEILEVREARMVLKHVGTDRSIKIGGGRKEKAAKDEEKEKPAEEKPKKRERRRQQRRRKVPKTEELEPEKVELPQPNEDIGEVGKKPKTRESASSIIRSLLSPPPLISETIDQYRESYQQAFFEKEEEAKAEEEEPKEKTDPEETLPVVQPEQLPVVKEEELPVVVEEGNEEESKKSLWDFTD